MFFLKKLFHSFHSHPYFQYPCPSSPRIWTTLRHCDVNITSKSHYLLNRWPYFHWFEKSSDIDVTMLLRRADPWTCHVMDMWVERMNLKNLKKIKVCNETVIDCLFGQQQFCLTLPARGFGQQIKFSDQTKLLFCSRTQSITVYMCQNIINQYVYNYTFFKPRFSIGSLRNKISFFSCIGI